jgi:hypothetical protein
VFAGNDVITNVTCAGRSRLHKANTNINRYLVIKTGIEIKTQKYLKKGSVINNSTLMVDVPGH